MDTCTRSPTRRYDIRRVSAGTGPTHTRADAVKQTVGDAHEDPDVETRDEDVAVGAGQR